MPHGRAVESELQRSRVLRICRRLQIRARVIPKRAVVFGYRLFPRPHHVNIWHIAAGTVFPFWRIRSTRTAQKMHTDHGRKLTVLPSLRIIGVCGYWRRRKVRPPKDSLFMRTFVASAKSADSRWHVIDAEGQVLGRVATLTARLLQGKHKAIYTPFIDTGDHVVIVNAAEVKLTGRKEDQKLYRYHSGTKADCARSALESCGSASRSAWWRKRFAACCLRPKWVMRCIES